VLWWGRSSLQDNYKSRVRVGDFFRNKFSKSVGLPASAAYYISAALHKDPQASFNMGIAYARGEGVPRDQKISELFFSDSVKHEKKGSLAVGITRKWLNFLSFLRKYKSLLLILVPLWAVVFAVILGLLLVWDSMDNVGLPVPRERLFQRNPIVHIPPPRPQPNPE
jgi:hypothetical protein